MIITRTPYRISFFGGGTDYHTWYQTHGGSVLSTTINHYCYLTCRHLPPFFPEKSRVVWSKIEQVQDHADIQHPAVRAILDYMNIEGGVEIHHTGDLPARAGLGSSSAFTVGLLNAVNALQGRMSNKRELACEAVHVEREILRENVGVQDQIATAYGGFNKITILQNGDFRVEPVILPAGRSEALQSHMLLFFTGISRSASAIAADQMQSQARGDKKPELNALRELVDEAVGVITAGNDLLEFGRLLHETWQIKRSLSPSIAPDFVDDIYARARAAGAIGGKLLGAGGGGFMLFFVHPDNHVAVLQALEDLLWVPFEFETSGSGVVYFDHTAYSRTALERRDYYHLKRTPLEAARETAEVIELKRERARRQKLTLV
jgi:D-glycero-alpha-D-manno-heptose-7-phosphate kinase